MKKSIAILALAASSSAFGRVASPTETKTICLSTYENENGTKYAGNCDEAANNVAAGLKILENGCAEGQVSLTSGKYRDGFDINIRSCLPPNVAQL